MRTSGRRVWTTGRQLVGNTLPLLVASPALFMAARAWAVEGLGNGVLVWAGVFVVGTWLATGLLAMVGNGSVRRAVEGRLNRARPLDKVERWFVGAARPAYRGVLDPHEDVGFLLVYPERLEFFGGHLELSMSRAEARRVRQAANPHTWLGLGGWVKIDGERDGRNVALLLESREKTTLFGNRAHNRALERRLTAWLAGADEPAAP
jgi:hypothetical protein